jgi:hypothetical protein
MAAVSDIAAGMRVSTERLAAELAAPSPRAPDWSPLEWKVARVAAVMHGVSPLLAGSCQWQEAPEWRAFLQQQREQVRLRHQRIESLLDAIDAAAQREGIALTLLKGASLHRMGYCRAGERPMGDVDLLVAPAKLAGMARVLVPLGYRETAVSWRHRIYENDEHGAADSFGERADGPIKIEVHTRVAERLPWTEVDTTALLMNCEAGPGARTYASVAAALWHQLSHAAGNMSTCWLRLLQLHDIQRVASAMQPADWQLWLQQARAAGHLWWTYPPLALTARYFAHAVPSEVLLEAAAHCGGLLRGYARGKCVTDLSGSSLWVRAAPALPWAQSPREMAHYLLRRVFPVREETRFIREHAQSQSWNRQGNWYSSSNARRAMSWLFARPVRPQVLQSLQQMGVTVD